MRHSELKVLCSQWNVKLDFPTETTFSTTDKLRFKIYLKQLRRLRE